ncbi:unnamed protein product [Euphydryas editha]|uniref:Uncharacterized protein n=1 Tax=Euphydryas editha TaxID=104508 RepID=A0AAU9UGA8_EUPED|nr:unnamed protein product [Euphydryas editha]
MVMQQISMPPQKEVIDIILTLVDSAVASQATVYGSAVMRRTERLPICIAMPPSIPPIRAPVTQDSNVNNVVFA